MRDVFPAHFRPNSEELALLWKESTFAVDANVLLNLYRYSPETRTALENALSGVKSQLFVPHQAAKEFLRNRLTVTAAQADEYTKASKEISDLASKLENKKRHPFLPDAELPEFKKQVKKVVELLEAQRAALLERLTKDEILEFIQALTDGRTGPPLTAGALEELAKEGEIRYLREIPPGYKDGKKDATGDPYRKFGDLIAWKQLIAFSKTKGKSLIFVTDDKKDDWWIEHTGRTIGPRTELREEFMGDVGKDFWMYTVDLFLEESAKNERRSVSATVLEEIRSVRQEVEEERRTLRVGPGYARTLLQQHLRSSVLSDEEIVMQVARESHTPVQWVSRQLARMQASASAIPKVTALSGDAKRRSPVSETQMHSEGPSVDETDNSLR